MTIEEKLIQAKADLDAVYEAGKKAGSEIGTSDAPASAADIDYDKTAYANGEKITGTKHRREYKGNIVTPVVGLYSYAVLAGDSLLAEVRTLDTLFVRAECDIEPTVHSVRKTWASNVNGELIPTTGNQLVYRFDSVGDKSQTNILRPLYQDPSTLSVGQLHITEDGELRLYSASANYTIRPCDYNVIVEW